MLSLPQNKKWTEKDLEDETFLKVGLHLLYNKIQGKKTLHLGKSIHINYTSFPVKIQEKMKKERTSLSQAQKKAARKAADT